MTPVLEVQDLSLHYVTRFGERVQAVDRVSFTLQKGEILGIAGESGCGKTTLVSGCMGLYLPPLHPIGRSFFQERKDSRELVHHTSATKLGDENARCNRLWLS